MEAQQTQSVQQGIKKEGFHITVTQMCITAVFMALTCVATMVVQIPIPLGYAHLGDSVILICAFFFGPVVGALAGGIGSAMADILTGFAVWAVPTLIIKTIMPIIACAIFGNMKSKFDRCKVISVKGIVVDSYKKYIYYYNYCGILQKILPDRMALLTEKEIQDFNWLIRTVSP